MTLTVSGTDWFYERQRSRGLAVPELRSAMETQRLPTFYPSCESSFKLTLGRGIWEQISDEVRRDRFLEVGGWLLSDPRWPEHIVTATMPGSDIRYSPQSVMLGTEALEALREMSPHLECVGDWHLHTEGSARPSETDLRAWAANAKKNRSGFHAGVIVTPAPDMWSEPGLHGWITTNEDNGQVCERLRVERV
jgi:proteasome lid subunit RPN8/RPN11